MMTDKQFYTVWSEAHASGDREAFVSDWVLSSLFCDADEPEAVVDQELVKQLGQIWEVAHMSIKDIRMRLDLSQAGFATRFCIPKRTVENWEAVSSSHRDCPSYVRLLIVTQAGLIDRG